MIKLSGILEYSMGGFLCLRGFASYKMLSAISKPNTEVQRGLIDEHKGDMARFLNAGEYKFFPEVILATNLTMALKILMRWICFIRRCNRAKHGTKASEIFNSISHAM